MKITKNIFIFALLVLMLLCCVNAASAEETFNETLGADVADDLAIDVAPGETLSASGDTYVVDGNGNGDYTTISDAVSAATGGETIFIKNGEYSESAKISVTKSLNFVGESKDGVTIKSTATNGVFETVENGVVLSFVNLNFKDISAGNIGTLNIGGDSNLDVINCTFDNCKSKYGTMWIKTTGTVNIENTNILNSVETATKGATAIYLQGAGNYNIKDTVIDNAQYGAASGFSYGTVYVSNSAATTTLDNVLISNCAGNTYATLYTYGKASVKNSRIVANTVPGATGNTIIRSAGNLIIEQSVIANNTAKDYLIYCNNGEATLNYNYVANNTVGTSIYGEGGNTHSIDADYNYWGSNDQPTGVPVNNWVIGSDGEYTLNDGGAVEKDIPIIMGSEPIVLPEGTIYVSEIGNDENDGSSEANAVATIKQAIEIAKARENKQSTIYLLNGEYTTDAIDIGDDEALSIDLIGQEKNKVTIHGTGNYIFDIYGDNLVWNFKNINFMGVDSTARTSAALVLYSKNGNFTIDNCIFKNINSKLGAFALGNDNGNANVTNCLVEDVTGSASNTAIVTINGDGNFILDNVEINHCGLQEDIYSSSNAYYIRDILYVNTYEAVVTVSNSKITNNYGPMYCFIESRAKLTLVNTTISDNVINTSTNGANGGDVLIWASNDNSDISIEQCVIVNNVLSKAGKGLIYAQKGSTDVEYCAIANNVAEDLIAGTSSLTADNNWWGTNEQPNANVVKWVIMNVACDDSDLSENNQITLTIDFNHVKTSSGDVEELTGGVIPQKTYSVTLTSQNGEITPAIVEVKKGEIKEQTFTVTSINDVITVSCDNAVEQITIEGVEPYKGIIYVNKSGNNDNDGSKDAPVATLDKAMELAYKASGQIIIDEGTYIGNTYHVTQALNITGVGNVVLDADGEGRLFTMNYGDAAEYLILNNLTLSGAMNSYGQAIYSFADELVLNNVNITNNPGSGTLVKNYGKLTMDNCIIAGHNGASVIDSSGSKDIIINNTIFENNVVTDYAIVYASSTTGNAIVENTVFRNNTGQLGIFKVSKKTNVKNSKFIDNTNVIGYGGAISDFDTLNVINSTFINNKAAKDSGAINVGYNRVATITQSTFINNTANTAKDDYKGDAISNSGKLTINYCVLLTNANNSIIYTDSEYATNAQYNWWGSNDDPKSLNGVGTYEDDWYEDAESELDSSNWVVMNVTTDMIDDTVIVDDTVEITVDFNNYIDSHNALQPLSEKIPDVNVSASAINGDLDSEVATTSNGIAKFVYTASVSGEDVITVSSDNATVEIPIFVDVSADSGIIYVSPKGDDAKDGLTKKNAVRTIAHAIEIATEGQIVLLEGVHQTNSGLGTISEDLNITGEGKAIIDAGNNNRILYVGSDANVVIKNVEMINGYTADESGALLGNGNKLTLINCVLANSSTGPMYNGGAIYSVGQVNIINTTIANCSAREGGAIFTNNALAKGNALVIVNSIFANNTASGNDNLGGGAIFAQQITEFTVDNSSFIDNKAGSTSSGGAIFISHSSATVTITDSTFIGNHANGQESLGGGAIYRSATSNYVKEGTLKITGTLFENNTCDSNGGAIYARATTVDVANSVFINNKDANGLAVYGYKTDLVTPTITLNDNWWGSNDSPKDLVGGNNRYKPTINRWAILTVTNDTAIEPGNTVKLTVSINNYTTGTTNGTLSKPITVKRDVTIKSTGEEINGILEDGVFAYDYLVPENIRYLAATVDDETVVLLVISSNVNVEVDDITAKKYDKVNVVINVTSQAEVNAGVVELYVDETLIDTIPVNHGKAIKDVVIPNDIGTYELIAKFVDESGLFDESQSNATLTVDGICELWNDTFFNFFDEEGLLRDAINEDELVFHGDFSGLGVNVITIQKPMTITGENAVLNDMAFALLGDDIKLSNVSLIADKENFADNSGAVILVAANGIELNNVLVNYTTPNNANAYGILASSANDFKLLDSAIVFDSNNNADVTQHALQLRDCGDFVVKGNTINASLPARDVAYGTSEPFFDNVNQDLVLAIGIQNGENGNLTENTINVVTKSALGGFPTIDSVLVYGAKNLEISWNNITHVDTVNAGLASYSNALDLYAFEGIDVKYNNIIVNITSGIEAKGTAYPIQATGSYVGLTIDHNNLTSISNGPALGIYSQNYDGETDITITFNNISATGLATENEYALVSGMELQDTYARVYNNTITTASTGSYDDLNKLFGISYAQYTAKSHEFDIRDNTVYTDGKYAVYLRDAANSNVTENTLYAHELLADEAVLIDSGNNNIIKDNRPYDGINISVIVDGATYPDNVTVKVEASVDGDYVVDINGTEYTVTANGEGISIKLGAGSYYANITGDYSGVIENTTFTVEPGVNNIVVEVNDTVLPGDVVVNVTASVDGVYTVVIGDYSVDVVVEAGVGSNTVSLPAGVNYTATSNWINANYTVNVVDAVFDVIKSVNAISVAVDGATYPDNVTVKVTATVDGDYVVDINGTEYTVTANGDGISINLGAGSYYANIAGDYASDDYTFTTENATFTVEPGVNNIVVEVNDTVLPGDVVVKVTADVVDTYTVTIGDTSVDVVVDETGEGTNTISLSKGKYAATTSWENENYTVTVTDAKFTVSRGEGFINITAEDITYGEDLIVEVTLPSDVARRASVTVGNETKLVILTNGVGSVKFSGLTAGTHTIVASYNGDTNYAVLSVNASVKVNRADVDIKVSTKDIKFGEDLVVNVTLSGDVSRRASVTVDNETKYAILTDGQGSVTFSGLAVGTHTVVVSYNGDNNYVRGNSVNTTVKVSRGPADIKVTADPVSYGEDVVVNVTLADATRRVNVTLGNESKLVSLVNGTASVKFGGLAVGSYDVAVSYNGDSNYIKSSASAVAKVIKAVPEVQVSANDINVGEDLVVDVQLPDDVSRRAIVTIGNESKLVILKAGIGTVKFTGLSVGTHEVVVSYAGDENYKSVTNTTTIEVKE